MTEVKTTPKEPDLQTSTETIELIPASTETYDNPPPPAEDVFDKPPPSTTTAATGTTSGPLKLEESTTAAIDKPPPSTANAWDATTSGPIQLEASTTVVFDRTATPTENVSTGTTSGPMQLEGSTTVAVPTDITTSIVTTFGTTTSMLTQKPRRRIKKTKNDLLSEYVYGRSEEEMMRIDPSIVGDPMPDYRLNRTYDLRRSSNARRLDCIQTMTTKGKEAEGEEVGEELGKEVGKRIIGQLPTHLFRPPKIPIRHTLGSKFRYLYNRRPPGVRVYFKNSKADPQEKPPFVTATRVCH